MSGLLSWAAQVAAHEAYLGQRAQEALAADPPPVAHTRAIGARQMRANRNRQALLAALSDGRAHRFGDIRRALPALSVQGVYSLIDRMANEQRIQIVRSATSRRVTYRLV